MSGGFHLFPQAASENAREVDSLFLVLSAGTLVIVGVMFVIILWFAIRYRRRKGNMVARVVNDSLWVEIAWSVIPLVALLAVFGWGARIYFDEAMPPAESSVVFVVGKQWMWKLQHPQGNREINELHVPVGRPIKLVMTSEDVVHSFFIPAFRIKQDVLPGRYTQLWFQATETGRFPLMCAEYCGTNHSRMRGWVEVMPPQDYQRWLSGEATGISMAQAGEKVFHRLGCATCHVKDAPPLQGLYRSRVALADGSAVIADERYLRESMIDPAAKVVRGFEPVMPTFVGNATEEEILQLIAYIRSLETVPPGSLPNAGATGRENVSPEPEAQNPDARNPEPRRNNP